MADQYGTILALDRVNGKVGARLDDGYVVQIDGAGQGISYRGAPPCPLSRCWFSDLGGGLFVCEGALGDSRVILHDDFTIDAGTAGFVLIADTPWTITFVGGGPSSASLDGNQQGAFVNGVATTAGNYASFHKDIGTLPPTPPAALWHSARWKPANTTLGATLTTRVDQVGLGDLTQWSGGSGVLNGVFWQYSSAVGANWSLLSAAAGSATRLDTSTAAADAFSWFDIVYVPGLWVAGWIDGDGPYVNTANVPASTTALGVGMQLLLLAGVTRYQTVDVQHLEWVSEVVDPQLVLDGR